MNLFYAIWRNRNFYHRFTGIFVSCAGGSKKGRAGIGFSVCTVGEGPEEKHLEANFLLHQISGIL